MKKVTLGLVGLNFGASLAPFIQKDAADWLELVAVCDADAGRLRQSSEQLGVQGYDCLDTLLARPDIEAIGLFTGPNGRAELIGRIIRAGKHVLTTKPFENDPDAALQVLEEARRLGKVVHLNSPGPLLAPDLAQVQQWREEYSLGAPVGCRADVWCRYNEQPDGNWYDDPERCPVAPVFRLGIYLINDLVRLFGAARQVQVLESRLFTARPTPDNAQLGILFQNGALANIFASFGVDDGDTYRNGLTLNFERGTIYRNVGPQRETAHPTSELALVMKQNGQRAVVAQSTVLSSSGDYQWEAFARAVRGETLPNTVTPQQIADGLRVVRAMAFAARTGNTVEVAS